MIRAREVRVISSEGEQLGVLQVREAIAKAEELGLDLVEVAPNAVPPVCRIMDFGKYKYEMSKKANESRKHQTVIAVKEIKFRPRTDDHDIEFKTNNIKRFLSEGDKVKVSIMFRGREMAHPEQLCRNCRVLPWWNRCRAWKAGTCS
jgi:translation initiation factor IF-3